MNEFKTSGKIKAIAFDLDGTLLNTITDLAAAMNFALAKNGLTPRNLSEYNHLVGGGIPKLIERIFARQDPPWTKAEHQDLFNILQADFDTRYREHLTDATQPYPGIIPLLKGLVACDYSVAVLTNKPDKFALILVEHFFSFIPWRAVIGQKVGFLPKPDLRNSQQLEEITGLSLQNWAMVGDSDVDVYTAKTAGMLGIGVDWGFRGEAELRRAGADFVAIKPSDIFAFLDVAGK